MLSVLTTAHDSLLISLGRFLLDMPMMTAHIGEE